jgi:hypothetical protein
MPEPTLQTTALRYAAGDLPPEEVAAFEARLGEDQDARDALAEAVRLSAQAIGLTPPKPHPSFHEAIRNRLNLRVYRGSPLAWIGLGAAAVAACTIIGLALAHRTESATVNAPVAIAPVEASSPPRAVEPGTVASAPLPREAHEPIAAVYPQATCGDDAHQSVAEIWADLSNHESVEKARDDELRWRARVRDLSQPHIHSTVKAAESDVRNP